MSKELKPCPLHDAWNTRASKAAEESEVSKLDALLADPKKDWKPHEKFREMRNLAIRLEKAAKQSTADWRPIETAPKPLCDEQSELLPCPDCKGSGLGPSMYRPEIDANQRERCYTCKGSGTVGSEGVDHD